MSWHENGNGAGPGPDARRVERTLATVDEALDTDRVTAMDPEDRGLQELALALREEAPRPRPDFAAALDERVRAGFPSGRDGRALRLAARLGLARRAGDTEARRPRRARRPSLPALAGVASVLLVLVVGGSLLATERDSVPTVSEPAGSSGAEAEPAPSGEDPAAGGGSGDALPLTAEGGSAAGEIDALRDGGGRASGFGSSDSALPPVPGPGGELGAGRDNRQVERAARMTLAAPAQDLQEIAAGIAAVADRRGGFLLSSSLTTGHGGATGGQFELRVPVTELEGALADLSELGEVRALTQTGEDLTAQFVAANRTAKRTRAHRAELERRLRAAVTEEEQDQLRARIRTLTAQLRAARAQTDQVRERTSFATVSISLEEGEARDGALGGAIDDMLRLLEGALALALRLLGVLVPLAIAGALVWLAGRAVRRRRREAALA